jgi:probable HAF family extracellular repeat protein
VTVIEGPRSETLGQASMYSSKLNEQGHIVGFFVCPTGYAEPFLWTPETGLIELPLPPDSYEAGAADINEQGQIVGWMTHNQLGYRGFLYDNGEYTILHPVMPDAGWSGASAINNNGTVAGYRSVGEGVNPYNAYIWSIEDGFRDLGLMDPYSRAIDISDGGTVLGWTGLPGWGVAFVWEDGHSHVLGPIPGGVTSTPGALNEDRRVVGCGWVEEPRSVDGVGKAYMWANHLWTIFDPLPACDSCGAWGINDVAQAVGFCTAADGRAGELAALWHGGFPYDLNALAELQPGFTIQRANAINNGGQIVADGHSPQWNDVTFLLTPIDRPTADITGDCAVDAADLLFLLGDWGETDSPADINDDGVVNFWDLLELLANWG